MDEYNAECENCQCYTCRKNENGCHNCEKCSADNSSKNVKFQNDRWKMDCNSYVN